MVHLEDHESERNIANIVVTVKKNRILHNNVMQLILDIIVQFIIVF